jgi:4'-phosphopantetheinyl transferase
MDPVSVYWLTQRAADVPEGNDWLTRDEQQTLAGLRIAKRRSDWRLGRWTAKSAAYGCTALHLHAAALDQLEVRASASGAPQLFVGGNRTRASISLSHTADVGLCALSAAPAALGCDVELVAPHGAAFIRDYFTAAERARIDRSAPAERPGVVTLLWSAKESALKALGDGLRRDTRDVEVIDVGSGQRPWQPLRVGHMPDGAIFSGWWRREAGTVLTILATAPVRVPVRVGGAALLAAGVN